jgi:hypothetical protein
MELEEVQRGLFGDEAIATYCCPNCHSWKDIEHDDIDDDEVYIDGF